ncbi:MAG: hypothetical protein GTO30_04150, partial [Acidobacteria bacterium]|nr:hypothetical protein [Acidobacteriota bacterium]NIQ83511.1 hypothetical protein [Acidobacteriota bacterium]
QEGVADERRDELNRELAAMPGVTRVEHIDKEEALARYQDWAGEMALLIDDLETNPLPESLEVFLAPGPSAEMTGAQIQSDFSDKAGVEQVRFDRELLASRPC